MTINRVYTPREKLKNVLEWISCTTSVVDLCRKYDLRPYLGEVFTLKVRSIDYRKVVVALGFPGNDDIEEFDDDGYMNALSSLVHDVISDFLYSIT